MKKQLILNLGGGDSPIKNTLNVDSYKSKYVDQVIDLTQYPWPWKQNSVDGIYLIHVLEHIQEPIPFLKECHRVLKKGGFLYIQVPHSSNVTAVGDMTHFRTFCHPTLHDLLTHENWIFKKALFTTKFSQLVYWDTRHCPTHPYVDFVRNQHARPKRPLLNRYFILPLAPLIQKLIDLSPSFFERFWCYYVGGADEVVWKGTKI